MKAGRRVAGGPGERIGKEKLVSDCLESADRFRHGRDYAKAEKTLRRALRTSPRDAKVLFALGDIYRVTNRFKAMRPIFREVLRLAKDGALRPFERFLACVSLKDYENAFFHAENALDEALRIGMISEFWNPYGDDSGLDEAFHRSHLERLDLLKPPMKNSPWHHFYRGTLLNNLSCPKEALSCFDQLRASDRGRYGWMLYPSGRIKMHLGRQREALKDYAACLASMPSDWFLRCTIGESHVCMREFDKGLREFEKALQATNPVCHHDILAWRGQMELWVGRYSAARTTLDEAVRKGGLLAHCWRGAALFKLGDPDAALADLDRATEIRPHDAEAFVWKAEIHRTRKDYRRAEAEAGQALRIVRGHWWALANRSLARLARRDRSGSRADFAMIPETVIGYVREKLSLAVGPLSDKQRVLLLQECFRLGLGNRHHSLRENLSWMDRP